MAVLIPEHCELCPRRCGADRRTQTGRCGAGNTLRAARAALHRWEEPCISGEDPNGAPGAVFSAVYAGLCFLVRTASSVTGAEGKKITTERLAEVFLALQAQGAYNINLITPTQYLPWILEALNLCGERLAIPVLYNTGGYERVEMLRLLEGRVQIYLPDLKYYDSALSARYSAAPDYFAVAAQALREMFRQVGPVRFDENGMLQSGMVVRHLVLPGAHKDSLRLLNWLADNFSPEDIRLSLMSQYTPPAGIAIRELQRPIFTYEYRKACERRRSWAFWAIPSSVLPPMPPTPRPLMGRAFDKISPPGDTYDRTPAAPRHRRWRMVFPHSRP